MASPFLYTRRSPRFGFRYETHVASGRPPRYEKRACFTIWQDADGVKRNLADGVCVCSLFIEKRVEAYDSPRMK